MKRVCSITVLAFLVALLTLVSTTQQVSAHGGRTVAGKYHFVVGFLEEPAYAQLKNGLDLTICTNAIKGHDGDEEECEYKVENGTRVLVSPIEKAEATLKAEVTMGSASPQPLTLSPRFGNPGKYAAYFMPTKEGAYTFHISGTLNGDKVDEKFTSGKDDFSEVSAITAYPATQNTSANPGSNEAVSQSQLKAAENTANTAMTVGIIGSILGLLGVALAAFALLGRRSLAKGGEATSSGSAPADELRG